MESGCITQCALRRCLCCSGVCLSEPGPEQQHFRNVLGAGEACKLRTFQTVLRNENMLITRLSHCAGDLSSISHATALAPPDISQSCNARRHSPLGKIKIFDSLV